MPTGTLAPAMFLPQVAQMNEDQQTPRREPASGEPYEIAEGVWWVGCNIEGDEFQCHSYLIEHGDQSVLIDPGAPVSFVETLGKIAKVTPFENIRYFVCHHPDPDITAALPQIDGLLTRSDAFLVSHWRAYSLLKHYELKHLSPFLIEKEGWRLDLNGRVLEFRFTPYAHFPGAFVTYDTQTKTLFSSDLLGGFSGGFQLFAKDLGYFEQIRPFHEHYMPSNEVLRNAISNFSDLELDRIAPQHGSIIERPLIEPNLAQLAQLECGLYLMAKQDTDVWRLSLLNRALRELTNAMIGHRDFPEIADTLGPILSRLLPIERVEFFSHVGQRLLHLSPDDHFRGDFVEPPARLAPYFAISQEVWRTHVPTRVVLLEEPDHPEHGPAVLLALCDSHQDDVHAFALFTLSRPLEELEKRVIPLLGELAEPIQVAVERGSIHRVLDFERWEFYERSIRDPLTKFFTRVYMHDTITRLLHIHDRNESALISLVMFDIDRFKSVNDTFGHGVGDSVLRDVSMVVHNSLRSGDIPIRLGGDEIAVFLTGASVLDSLEFARRVRAEVEATTSAEKIRVTLSAGVAERHQGESLNDLLHRADTALYRAKDGGRNQVCKDPHDER